MVRKLLMFLLFIFKPQRSFFLLLLLLCSRITVGVEPDAETSSLHPIIGGQAATTPRPWMVAFLRNSTTLPAEKRHFCGGVLITSAWVLTAAHCIEGVEPDDYELAIGDLDLGVANLALHAVAEQVQHPFYDDDLLYNDIALVRLQSTVSNTPVPLANASMIAGAEGSDLQAIGWGATTWIQDATCTMSFTATVGVDQSDYTCKTFVFDPGTKPTRLMQTDLRLQSMAQCDQRYKAFLDTQGVDYGTGVIFSDENAPDIICLWDSDDSSTVCFGDSGGPAVKMVAGVERVFGIASFLLDDCSRSNQVAVFTRVSYFEAFIQYTVGRSLELGSANLCPDAPSPTLAYAARSDGKQDVTLSWNTVPGAEGYRVFYAPYQSAGTSIERVELGAGSNELAVVLASGMKFFVGVQSHTARCDSALSPLLTVNVP